MSMPQLHSLFLNPTVYRQYEQNANNQMVMRNAVTEAKSNVEGFIDEFLKQVIVIMENNKNLVFTALETSLDSFSGFMNSFNQKVDDFVKESLMQLATAQQKFDMESSQQIRKSINANNQSSNNPAYPTIDHEIEMLKVQQKRTEMHQQVYEQIKESFSHSNLNNVAVKLEEYIKSVESGSRLSNSVLDQKRFEGYLTDKAGDLSKRINFKNLVEGGQLIKSFDHTWKSIQDEHSLLNLDQTTTPSVRRGTDQSMLQNTGETTFRLMPNGQSAKTQEPSREQLTQEVITPVKHTVQLRYVPQQLQGQNQSKVFINQNGGPKVPHSSLNESKNQPNQNQSNFKKHQVSLNNSMKQVVYSPPTTEVKSKPQQRVQFSKPPTHPIQPEQASSYRGGDLEYTQSKQHHQITINPNNSQISQNIAPTNQIHKAPVPHSTINGQLNLSQAMSPPSLEPLPEALVSQAPVTNNNQEVILTYNPKMSSSALNSKNSNQHSSMAKAGDKTNPILKKLRDFKLNRYLPSIGNITCIKTINTRLLAIASDNSYLLIIDLMATEHKFIKRVYKLSHKAQFAINSIISYGHMLIVATSVPGHIFKIHIDRERGIDLKNALSYDQNYKFEKIPCGNEIVTTLILREKKQLSEIDGRPSNSRKDFIDLIFFGGIENGNVITWKIRKFLRNANSDSIQFSQAEILTIQKAHDICINSLCLLGDNGQRLVTGAQDCKIKLYDVMEKPISDNNRTISLEFVAEVQDYFPITKVSGFYENTCFVAAAGSDNVIKIWNLEAKE